MDILVAEGGSMVCRLLPLETKEEFTNWLMTCHPQA